MSGEVIGLFVALGFFAMVCFVVYVVLEWRRRREQQRVELHPDWFDLTEDEEGAIAMFMSRVANVRLPDPDSPILSSNTLWWKAKLLDKWEAERRAQWPLDIMQLIEIAGGLVAAGLLLYWSLPYFL